ncbi:MAG: hypothetical protein JWQ61_1553 [Collimonas fungivorans]|nr:hypothetical protein [Collimonas fungivorans]
MARKNCLVNINLIDSANPWLVKGGDWKQGVAAGPPSLYSSCREVERISDGPDSVELQAPSNHGASIDDIVGQAE